MQAFGFLARKVGALFFEEIGALLDFLVGRADDEFFGFGYALFGGLGVGAALILTAFVLALPKRAALVFRLPLAWRDGGDFRAGLLAEMSSR